MHLTILACLFSYLKPFFYKELFLSSFLIAIYIYLFCNLPVIIFSPVRKRYI